MQEGTKLGEDKTPWQEFIEDMEEKGRSSIRFFAQRRAILRDPSIIAHSDMKSLPGWKSPLSFAIQGLLLVTLSVSFLGYIAQNIFDLKEGDLLDGIASSDVPQQLKNHEDSIEQFKRLPLHTRVQISYPEGIRLYDRDEGIKILEVEAIKLKHLVKLQTVNKSLFIHLQPFIANIILILSAVFFRRGVMKDYGATGEMIRADRHYLYVTTARLFWLNLILAVVLEMVRLGPTDSMLTILGILYFIWLILSIYFFYKVSADFFTSLNVPRPKSLWGQQNKMFSRLFSSNFKSSWIVLIVIFAVDYVGFWLIAHLIIS